MVTRQELFAYYQSYAEKNKEEIDNKKTRQPLLKTYAIETFDMNMNFGLSHSDLFEVDKKFTVRQEDDNLYSLSKQSNLVGYLEKINDRFWLLFTTNKTNTTDPLVSSLIKSSVYLDNMWISGIVFNMYWNLISNSYDTNRFIKMSFEYCNLFNKNDDLFNETNKTLFNIVEKKTVIERILPQFKQLLPSFLSMSSLRFPSPDGPGGNDVYSMGKITNRSDDFWSYRSQVIEICNSYKKITEVMEKESWFNIERNIISQDHRFTTITGSPITIFFNKPLPSDIFNKFIRTVFHNKQGPFRLWGNPIQSGPSLYHIYGIDMHLWQEIYLELSPTQFTIILPKGTCGNTIHRLISNIQRYLHPSIDIYIGNLCFTTICKEIILGGD